MSSVNFVSKGNLWQYMLTDSGWATSQLVRRWALPNVSVGSLRVIFRDIGEEMIHWVSQYDVILGGMYRMTNASVLQSLSQKKGVSIILQKDDVIRNPKYRRLYDNCAPIDDSYYQKASLLYGDRPLEAFRSIGFHRYKKVMESMHHKFMVGVNMESCSDDYSLCSLDHTFDIDYPMPKPHVKSVWTGSFNATDTALSSLEDAVIIDEPEVARAYYHEWEYLLAMSESLDWIDSRPNPDRRVREASADIIWEWGLDSKGQSCIYSFFKDCEESPKLWDTVSVLCSDGAYSRQLLLSSVSLSSAYIVPVGFVAYAFDCMVSR